MIQTNLKNLVSDHPKRRDIVGRVISSSQYLTIDLH